MVWVILYKLDFIKKSNIKFLEKVKFEDNNFSKIIFANIKICLCLYFEFERKIWKSERSFNR